MTFKLRPRNFWKRKATTMSATVTCRLRFHECELPASEATKTRNAMPAIIDSNVSTILTASVLYQFGTGPVKGFAVTLIAGIVASLFTAIFVVRTFYLLWLNRSRGAQTLSI